jgi:RND family efflux transporter MFP subunit
MKFPDGETTMKEWNHRNFILSCFLAAMILIAGLASGCKDKKEKEAVKRPEVAGVAATPVSLSMVDEVYEATGTVQSDRTSIVASRVMGVVTSLFVREGDTVKAGQVLLAIDDRDAVQRVRAAEMAVESAKLSKSLAESTWQRYKNLYDEKALSRQEMDQIETQKKVAEAEYERTAAIAQEAKTYLSFTRVTAPLSGRVTEKRIDAGSMVSPGVPLMVIEGGGGSYIEASIDAGLGAKVKTRMTVEAMVETLNQPLTGTIREVFPSVDSLSRTFTIKVGLKDARPRSGLFARIRIPIGKREAILIPEKAIVRKGQLTGVYAVDDQGIVIYRLIRTGNTSADGTEVLSGLTVNDRVIMSGIEKVKDGDILTGGKTK